MYKLALIKPFKAFLYNKNIISQIEHLVCPAYDIILQSDIPALLAKHPYNMVNLERPIGADCYKNAAKIFQSWKNNSVLTQDKTNCIYIYEQNFEINGELKTISGIICLVKLENFRNKVVLPHENTLEKPKNDRFELLKYTKCNFSPIFSLYNDQNSVVTGISGRFSCSEPFIDFTDDANVSHKLWRISDPSYINKICDAFKNKKIYIADGHHRYETALAYKNYTKSNNSLAPQSAAGYVMMYLVDVCSPGLTILPTHRLIKNTHQFEPSRVIEACKKHFNVKKHSIKTMRQNLEAAAARGIHAIGLFCGGEHYFQLENNSLSSDVLDVDILQNLVLEPGLNLFAGDSSAQGKIDYTTELSVATAAVRSGKCQCAFIMNPTSIEQIMSKATSFEKMPQKSTYFYPKPITGLVINQITG